MTPGTGDPLLASLRDEFAAIAALLDDGADPAVREEAKQRIVRLFRRVEAGLGALEVLKGDIRGLVERYKQLERGAGDQPAPAAPTPLVRDELGASTFIEKGWSLIALGDAGGAMRVLHRALELSPGNLQALALLGWAEMLDERLDDALATFSKVLASEPTHALARVNVGYICLKKRIFGEAIEHLSRVIRLGNDPRATLYAHYYLGLVYLERGMFADARGFLEQAIALGPNLIEAYYDLGRAQWLSGQREPARQTWSRGANANRYAPWARRCQELLERTARGEEVPRSLFS
ncbi:MAG: tetratricopeptide repeat protein [Gemmatimonadales bacterium]